LVDALSTQTVSEGHEERFAALGAVQKTDKHQARSRGPQSKRGNSLSRCLKLPRKNLVIRCPTMRRFSSLLAQWSGVHSKCFCSKLYPRWEMSFLTPQGSRRRSTFYDADLGEVVDLSEHPPSAPGPTQTSARSSRIWWMHCFLLRPCRRDTRSALTAIPRPMHRISSRCGSVCSGQ